MTSSPVIQRRLSWIGVGLLVVSAGAVLGQACLAGRLTYRVAIAQMVLLTTGKADTVVPRSALDLFSDETLIDPYPAYRALRDIGPVVYLERIDAWVFPRYDEVHAALGNWSLFSPAEGVGLYEETNQAMKGTILASVPPEHTTSRNSVTKCLSSLGTKDMRIRLAELAEEFVDAAVRLGSFDAVETLARAYPLRVMSELIGFPEAVQPSLLRWADSGFQTAGPPNSRCLAAMPALMEMVDFLGNVQEADMRPGGLGQKVMTQALLEGSTEVKATELLQIFTTAAIDTTISALGHALWRFARHPDQWNALRENPSLIPSALSEVLRMDAPIQLFTRQLTAPTTIGDVDLAAGTRVILLFGSANRDERHYPDPDVFDVRRNPADHLAFGYGLHACAGQGLARMELTAMFSALVKRIKAFHVEDCRQPQRHLNNLIRSIERLPMVIEPR